jgi:hypothetical protein
MGIDLRENGNFVRQLLVLPWHGDAEVMPFEEGRSRGPTIKPPGEGRAVLLITNGAKPPEPWTHVIPLRGLEIDKAAPVLDIVEGKWLKHPLQFPQPLAMADFEAGVSQARESWQDAFSYKRENPEKKIEGLRPPQIGSIFAVQAHWTVNVDPATVVLPTGVGKTESMLSLLVVERCEGLLVVVPTDALRTQIFEKFLQLGLLKDPRFQVVSEKAHYLVVGVLNHRPAGAAEVDSFFRKCNVIVTTMALASQCEPAATKRMADLCSCLFIDEAHHVAAPTWKTFKDAFKNNRNPLPE